MKTTDRKDILTQVNIILDLIDKLKEQFPAYKDDPCSFTSVMCSFMTGRWASNFHISREERLEQLQMISEMSIEVMDVYDQYKQKEDDKNE